MTGNMLREGERVRSEKNKLMWNNSSYQSVRQMRTVLIGLSFHSVSINHCWLYSLGKELPFFLGWRMPTAALSFLLLSVSPEFHI